MGSPLPNRMRASVAWLVLALLLLSAVALASAWRVQAAPAAQAPSNPPSARNGHAIYQENCAPCHGPQGGGDGPVASQIANGVPALADPAIARRATPAEWFEITKEGRMANFMPPWKSRLTDEQIWDVVAFAFTLHTNQAELSRGEQVWGEQCAACHGQLGAGDGPQAPAAMPSLNDPALVANSSLDGWFQVTSAGKDAMPGFADVLSEEERWSAVEYARTFSFLPMTAPKLASGEGRISGVVTNGTPGGGPVDGLTVTLRPYLNFEEQQPITVTVGADGQFVFDGLPTAQEYVYLATTSYRGIDFGSQPARFESGASIDLPLPVYETGDAPGNIAVSLAQWFVDYEDGALLVGELYRVNHESDRVYTGGEEVAPGKKAVLTFELPAGATNLALDGGNLGDRFILADGAVVDTQPLAPGGRQILLRYLLPYSGTRAEIEHAVPYPVAQFQVLVNDQGADVTVDGFTQTGTQVAADREFATYDAANLPANEPVRVEFRHLARGAPAGSSNAVLAYHPGLLFGLAALVGAAVLGLAVLALALGRRSAEGAAAPDVTANLVAKRQQLLQAIADLDDEHQAGSLDDETYQSQRTALKRSLLHVTRQLDEHSVAGATAQATP